MYVYVFMYVCMYVCVYIYIYIYATVCYSRVLQHDLLVASQLLGGSLYY